MDDSKTYIVTAIAEIRKLSTSLLQLSLGKISLQDALNDLAKSVQKINKINIVTEWTNYAKNIPSKKFKLSIYRIVEESLNNTIKHAVSDKCFHKSYSNERYNCITFKDDGIGFNINQKKRWSGAKEYSNTCTVIQ